MQTVALAKEQETGIPILDDQHKLLYQAVADLEGKVRHKSAHLEIEHALNDLARHIRVHFESEEQMMAAFDVPERRSRARVTHTRLFEDITKLISEHHSGTQAFDEIQLPEELSGAPRRRRQEPRDLYDFDQRHRQPGEQDHPERVQRRRVGHTHRRLSRKNAVARALSQGRRAVR